MAERVGILERERLVPSVQSKDEIGRLRSRRLPRRRFGFSKRGAAAPQRIVAQLFSTLALISTVNILPPRVSLFFVLICAGH